MSHQERIAHEAQDDRGGAAHRLVPHCSMVGVVLSRTPSVTLVDDPHLLAEEVLCDKIDGDHNHEAGAKHEQPLVAPLRLIYPSAFEDQSGDFEVEHDRDACKNESRVNSSTTCTEWTWN